MEQTTAQGADARVLVETYLDSFNARDKERCLAFYADDATLTFMSASYRGHQAIGDWLDQRFAAESQLVRIDGVDVQGDTVTVDGVVTSKRLKAWRIGNLGGRVTVRLEEGKIKEITFGLRKKNLLEGW